MEEGTERDIADMTMELRIHSKEEQQLLPSVSIQLFPEEILLQIFSHLTLRELCNTVAEVCTQWERIHWDHELYRVPSDLYTTRTKSALICLKAARCTSPHFDELYINKTIKTFLEIYNEDERNEPDAKKIDKLFLKEVFIMLAHLRVMKFRIEPKFPRSLSDLFNFCIQVEELTVDDSEYFLSDAELASICDQLRGTLRVLCLNRTCWTVDAGKTISNCTHLEDLTIEASESKPSLECIHEIANISSLRRLHFKYCSFDTDAKTSIFLNHSFKELTSLDLQYCTYNDKVALVIGANLKNLTELCLELRCLNSYVTSEGLAAIITGCNKLTRLEVHCGGGHSIDPTFMLIPEYLPGLKDLVVVCQQLAGVNWKTPLEKKMPGLVIREYVSKDRQYFN